VWGGWGKGDNSKGRKGSEGIKRTEGIRGNGQKKSFRKILKPKGRKG